MASFDERVGFYFDWITLSSAFVAVDVSFSLSTKDARGHWAKRSKKVGGGGGGGDGEGKKSPAAEHRHFTERRSSANGSQ